jgi:hypothetical protein
MKLNCKNYIRAHVNMAIRVKKSPCEGWLRFLIGQKWSSSRQMQFWRVAHIFFPQVIYENVDIMFIEIYRIR